MNEDKSKLIEVFSGTAWEADLVKSLLGSNGIPAVLKDDTVVNVVLPALAVEVGVFVNECDREAAAQVVNDYREKEKQANGKE